MKDWSNLAKVVFKRTYARNDTGKPEQWDDTIKRIIEGNIGRYRGTKYLLPNEEERLNYFLLNRKAGPAGRGYWFSGAPSHKTIGGAALVNCWHFSADTLTIFPTMLDLLMLGGGIGVGVCHRYVSKLPKVKKNVIIGHKETKDADFIIPDSRQGWVELLNRMLEAFFVTGKSFTYSTICLRGHGEPIKGFGGKASGPKPVIEFVSTFSGILNHRAGKNLRPIDVGDLVCSIAELVVSGNVRRSAIILIGDAFDKEYLQAKRWDLGVIPRYRANANYSVYCDDIEDLHPLFWKTYEQGEPFGIINLKNIQTYGRMGEKKMDSAVGVNPCAEACLESNEPCNLQEIPLPNLNSAEEFEEAARLMHRWGKRVTMETYHYPQIQEVIDRNRRIGTGITGCLQAPQFFNPEVLNRVFAAIQNENVNYSKQLGIAESIRTTVIKPSGTISKVFDVTEGIHAGYSRHMIQRVRFSSNDPLISLLREAGHYIEPQIKFDGTMDNNTLVVDFYIKTPDNTPVADEDWTLHKQLDTLLLAQRHWSDQAVSVTVYYRKEEIPALKQWLSENLQNIKTISFLCFNDHGFKQAPKEAITADQYETLSAKIKPLDITKINQGDLEDMECAKGACPVK